MQKEDASKARPKALRPRDAATLILVDRSAGPWRVLMGKRHARHVFMPDLYVFPGGRRDRRDHALPFDTDMHPAVLDKLVGESRSSKTPTGARALALAALRELHEETGISIGERDERGLRARLDGLRYVARAITPPGMVRRFDTRFFCTFADEAGVDPAGIRDSNELHDLRWVELSAVGEIPMPEITRSILEELRILMDNDPGLPFGLPVPFFFDRRRTMVRVTF
ncbi:NUDIX hydrolase [Gellertiella hungarica]|uniref:8-oxo-dGTP pyrophosphatase MutT (NUDIX family) n=1 Tax=Gellertiella hungarica TaxID=1572859 RepID=A0A7W6J8F9_9HYPH|nr:NUDIX domain-containing protein [Gellertiella hungarica]MBB4066709.1 8-oxo-dGTP pyrophosphatase MutT (NUDIX family) [Gellertiella hungarica]